jgi:hypothetical protein
MDPEFDGLTWFDELTWNFIFLLFFFLINIFHLF